MDVYNCQQQKNYFSKQGYWEKDRKNTLYPVAISGTAYFIMLISFPF